jgi:flagellar biosynthesis GTPase FlhF
MRGLSDLNTLFLVLFYVCLIALIIGIIKPQVVVRWGAEEKRNRKSVLKFYGIGVIAMFILFGVTSDNTKKTEEVNTEAKPAKAEQKKELTAEEKAAAEQAAAEKAAAEKAAAEKAAAEKAAAEQAAAEKAAAEKAAKEEEERIGYETGITYDQLARTPDDFKGKKAKFTGKVLQVMEGQGETQLRVAVSGNYDKVLYVAYKSDIINSRVLENDNVTIKGKSAGIYTYKSTMGGEISIPAMLVEKIDIN